MGRTETGSRPEEKPRETGKQRNTDVTTNCGEGREGEDVKIRQNNWGVEGVPLKTVHLNFRLNKKDQHQSRRRPLQCPAVEGKAGAKAL